MSLDYAAFTAKRGPVPLWRQVAAYIRQAITDGQLAPGDGLPGEQAIADAMDVSYTTVRKALALLRDEGLVETAVGIGSFVAEH